MLPIPPPPGQARFGSDRELMELKLAMVPAAALLQRQQLQQQQQQQQQQMPQQRKEQQQQHKEDAKEPLAQVRGARGDGRRGSGGRKVSANFLSQFAPAPTKRYAHTE